MDPSELIPVAEALPAPWWLLDFLGVLTLMLHLLVINVALGGSLISLFSRLKSAGAPPDSTLSGLFAAKIPTSFAVGINLGVAPLLFFQVLFHHFFYTSSGLMAVFWIMVIPLVIIGYYGAYINARKYGKSNTLATAALTVSCLVLLYVAFAFQNNISLMLQPEKWAAYFGNRSGTILSLDDPVLWPRYLHFITASVAVAGLFSAVVWSLRRRKGADGAAEKIRFGLRIFAVATMVQIVLGFWLLIALPKPVMMQFMGQNMTYTLALFLGIVLALAAVMTAVLGWLTPTLLVLLVTVGVMLLLRTFLRTAYLNPYFRLESLGLTPQYDVLAVFLVVFITGLVILGFMLKWAVAAGKQKGGGMNYPIWELTYIGGPSLIALIAVIHVYIAHLAVGGGLFLWLTDLKAFRENRPEIHGYLKKHISFFLLLTMVFGAVSGVGIWFIIALVNPAATTILIHNFVFGWAIEWVFFFGEIAALLIYYYYFDRMDRTTRLRIAFLYALFAWLSLFIINGIIDFMLTSGKWIETHNFWDGFFNPTFWPSLFFRSFIAFTFAGLFGYVTTVFLENEKFRRSMLRYCTKWLLLPMLGLIPSALWYFYAVPQSFREVAFGMNRDLTPFLHVLPSMTALIFIFGIVLSVASSRSVQKTAAFLLIPVGLFWMGGFEYTREIARKPFVISNFMYSNSILVSDVELLNREGVLKHAKWSPVDRVTGENKLEAGREIFNLECLACQMVGGIRNDILPLAGKFPYRGLLAQLNGMGKIRRYMPPFVGTEEEKTALAAYITSSLLKREVSEPPRGPASGSTLEETQIPPFDPKKDEYVLLAWNAIGMQEVSDCDEMFSYLPPGNTLEAQLLKRGPQPVLISEGVELSYKVEEQHRNPAGHVRFWELSEALYGKKLEANTGPAGKGVEGVFDWDAQKEVYRAKGVPLAPYREDGTFNAYPVVTVEAREAGSGKVLASTRIVAPVSTQMDCYRCHSGESRRAGAGFSIETAAAILQAHDRNEKTSLYKEALAGKPRLCQSCHADPSQEAEGQPGVLNLSAAMHGWHVNYMSGQGDEACQYCHPLAIGAAERGLRGIHGSQSANVSCSRCHGTFEDLSISLLNRESDKSSAPAIMKNIQPRMAKSAADIAPRTPWLENPDCFACHVDFQQPAAEATAFNHWNQSPEELYRSYRDNALIRCTGCHGASHALYPALNPVEKFRDVLQPMQYCGKPFAIGADKSCAVCHTQDMEDPIHHENMLRMVRDKGGFEEF